MADLVQRRNGDGWARARRLLSRSVAAMLFLVAFAAPDPASADSGDVGYQGPSHVGTGTPTGTKRSESISWFNDGSWWANLWDVDSNDFHIFRLDASIPAWVDTGVTTDGRANTHSDVLSAGGKLYISSHQFVPDGQPAVPGTPSYLYRYSYVDGTYQLDSGFPSTINDYKVETLTVDKELNSGVLWATWQQGNQIYVNRTTGSDNTTWGQPFALPGAPSVSVDDTSALVAFAGKIGVMWGSQGAAAPDGLYFSIHNNGDPSNAWTPPVAATQGSKSGDDHMNLKWIDASGGTVYAAIKTSYTRSSDPLIQLLKFSDGRWTKYTIATVAECPNRVIVLIDESTQRLRTFATYPKPAGTTNAGVCSTSGGAIYEKSSPLSDISFPAGRGDPVLLDQDGYLHNVSSTKQNITSATGLVMFADNNATSQYWYHYEPPTTK